MEFFENQRSVKLYTVLSVRLHFADAKTVKLVFGPEPSGSDVALHW
jgi:hypothetical protein